MNKKFYTLVASLLLAAGSGVYTPMHAAAIDVTTNVVSTITPSDLTPYDETNKQGGYQVGKSYFLGNDSEGKYLTVDGKTLKYTALGSGIAVENSLWTLTYLNAPEGAVAPQYTFVNKATGVVLAMNPTDKEYDDRADGVTELGGTQTEWLQAPSYRDPANAAAPIYAAVSDDEVVAFVETGKGDNTVTLVKMKKGDLDSKALKVTPYTLGTSNNVFTLSPNELNTMLGKAGETATKNSFFSLGFSPAATVNGGANIWAQDLQAVAVEQFELAYGQDKDDANWKTASEITGSEKAGIVKDAYASLYPKVDANSSSYKNHTTKDASDERFYKNENSYKQSTPQWVALRNREGKFLVVDTAYVSGTAQGQNGRITFTFDDLYNAKNETRFRNPKSYLFRFDYNPVTGTVEIQSMEYFTKVGATEASTDKFDEVAFVKDDAYTQAAVQEGSYWYANGTNVESYPTTTTAHQNTIVKAALGSVTEVTLGSKAASAPYNTFTITLGNSAAYVLTILPNTAYLLKITGSDTKDRIGKYVIDNLVGGQEIMEQAKRQNFQHMPAAQWILTSPTVTAGAPVTLTNREFTNTYNGKVNQTLYAVAGESDQVFFMNGDTLQFIPVTDLKDAYQGYKYVKDADLKETVFTFDYLHELMMDRSINTVDNKDSVVWVDANGGSMNFVLEKATDDEYGVEVSGIAKLKRRAYKIKVEDASKLQNDGRYLTYDANKKKYIVGTDANNATKFFLKENNEVEDVYIG